jgi:hypothetical protein
LEEPYLFHDIRHGAERGHAVEDLNGGEPPRLAERGA